MAKTAKFTADDRRFLSSVNREDLWLFIEAYKNQIKLSTSILEKQIAMLDRQQNMIDRIQRMIELESEALKEIRSVVPEIRRDVTDRVTTCGGDHQQLKSTLVDKLNGVNTRIYLGWVGMGSILLTLLGLLFTK